MLTRKEKHKLFVEIGKNIDKGDWNEVIRLGGILKKHEVNTCRYIKNVTDYKEIPVDNQLSKITKTVYVGTIDGLGYLTTVDEYAKLNKVTRNKAWRILNGIDYSQHKWKPVAEVLPEAISMVVEKYNAKGEYEATENYIDMCLLSGIHVEDLEDLILDGSSDKFGNTYELVGKGVN